MKKLRPMLSALLGMITSTLILRLMGLHYPLFSDPFDLGKAAQQCGESFPRGSPPWLRY